VAVSKIVGVRVPPSAPPHNQLLILQGFLPQTIFTLEGVGKQLGHASRLPVTQAASLFRSAA
jgi:hypothetical protein